MSITRKMEGFIEKSSWIRKMFEEGARLKGLYGAENVFDFSLGNPNVPPPELFQKTLMSVAADNPEMIHGYMPNPGYPAVRAKVAAQVSLEQGMEVSGDEILMTCGAAGGLNVIFKSILDAGDEVVVPSPYFVEYNFYADNHGGSIRAVKTKPDFSLDLVAIEAAICERTRAVLINSPNNPTGQVYSRESLEALGRMLEEKSAALGRTLYLISDEPYRKIIYDGIEVPGLFTCYRNTMVTTSYSKDLSLAGERIGYVALCPAAEARDALLGGMALANRILGFVNAPALMQRVVGELQGVTVDIGEYARKRSLLCDGLKNAGYEFTVPGGAFYLFPKSPIADDVAFVRLLQEEKVLAVPGSGFGGPGHIRLSYCVSDATITGAMPGFRRAMEKAKDL
ncbi:pyridoxal phosphate-dependent aminotransferase [Desulfobotulus mexicanus]|uniref:Aminotransferase n=1 Tax=Desulfobotulus mexicanus TaxID=2586642 RepID=A0A5Q4VIG0_9BACT|nr:pyridoxal phosphate-dependent aminotransferase [Desulfobotulus mexicanus]TYT76017.1 pyridoxal phosphate-dependent aminotransferase [Desulfobotulus mexicanus]